jgi:hypothetical protein
MYNETIIYKGIIYVRVSIVMAKYAFKGAFPILVILSKFYITPDDLGIIANRKLEEIKEKKNK